MLLLASGGVDSTVAARLCPSDARDLGVKNGEAIRVTTREGELLLRARLDGTVRRGTVVVPWQTSGGEGAATLITKTGQPIAVNVRRSR